MNRAATADLAALLVVTIWGASFGIQKVALEEIDPLALTFVRYLGMIGLGWGVLAGRRARGAPVGVARADLPRMALAGVLGYSIYIVLSTVGLARTTAFSTALLTGTAPLFATLLVGVLGLERVGPGRLAGLLVGAVGVGVFLADKLAGALPAAGAGDLLSLVGAFFFAAYSVAQKPLLERYPVAVTMAHTCTLGALPVLALAGPAALAQDWSRVSPAAWAALAWSVVVPVYLAWSIWSWVIARVGVSRPAAFMFLVPVAGGVVSWVLFGEAFGAAKLAGAGLILAGLGLARRGPAAAAAPAVSAPPEVGAGRASARWPAATRTGGRG